MGIIDKLFSKPTTVNKKLTGQSENLIIDLYEPLDGDGRSELMNAALDGYHIHNS